MRHNSFSDRIDPGPECGDVSCCCPRCLLWMPFLLLQRASYRTGERGKKKAGPEYARGFKLMLWFRKAAKKLELWEFPVNEINCVRRCSETWNTVRANEARSGVPWGQRSVERFHFSVLYISSLSEIWEFSKKFSSTINWCIICGNFHTAFFNNI